MKKSIRHLPLHKRAELKRITAAIRDYEEVYMVILFGSYARGTWVEDRYVEGHITYEYMSDYDILVVPVNTGGPRYNHLEEKLESKIRSSHASKTWVNVIVHDIKYMNNMIAQGEYFFSDIKKEGIFLYNSGKKKLTKPRPLNSAKRKKIAEEDFKLWFKSANEFLDTTFDDIKKKRNKKAVFELHQATERYYTTILLVYTHYKPKLHDIKKLGKQAAGAEPAFLNIIPAHTPEEKRLFKLLRKAYIDARYKKEYKITRKELEYLGDKVKKLQRLTKKMCQIKIESFMSNNSLHGTQKARR